MAAVSGFVLLQFIVVLVMAVVWCMAVSRHRISRSLSFILYVVCVTFIAFGYLLQITSTALEGAVMALRLQCLGQPFIGVCYYLFARDYCGARPLRRPVMAALLVLPALVMLAVLAWPISHPLFGQVTFTTANGFAHLVLTPGPLYILNAIYGYALFAAACVRIGRGFSRRTLPHVLRYLAVFMLAAVPVPVVQLLRIFAPPASGFNYLPMAFTLNAAIMGVYLMLYRFPEWQMQERSYVLEHMEDAFILLDEDGLLLDTNARARAYFPSLAGLAPGARPPELANLPETMTGDATQVSDLTLDRGEGMPPLHLRVTSTKLCSKGKPAGTSYLLYDVSETYQLLEDLQQLATLDSLTGINNRGTFFTQVQRDFDLSLRKNEPASLLMMDIDHFKRVNDEHGHLAGDQVLVAIAGILQVRLRHTDIMGRYGGEEIAVWLPGATTDGAALIADVIRRALEHTPFESDSGRFHVTISIGVAGLDVERHHSLEALIADADNALYAAKAEGRNRVVIFHTDLPPALD